MLNKKKAREARRRLVASAWNWCHSWMGMEVVGLFCLWSSCDNDPSSWGSQGTLSKKAQLACHGDYAYYTHTCTAFLYQHNASPSECSITNTYVYSTWMMLSLSATHNTFWIVIDVTQHHLNDWLKSQPVHYRSQTWSWRNSPKRFECFPCSKSSFNYSVLPITPLYQCFSGEF